MLLLFTLEFLVHRLVPGSQGISETSTWHVGGVQIRETSPKMSGLTLGEWSTFIY